MPHNQNNSVKDDIEATHSLVSPRSSQTGKYLDKIWDIRTSDAIDDGALVFMARCFIQATLPHSNPGDNTEIWFRRNGLYRLEVKSARVFDETSGTVINLGIPYGSIPRLLFVWMTTEALQTKEPRLLLGHSLSDFMKKIGLVPRGGERGDITRLKTQAHRLFRSEFTLSQQKDKGFHEKDIKISNERMLFWNMKNPEQGSLWESWVNLTPDFYEAITLNPTPLDIRALHALKASSLALDVYMWLSHRTFYLDKPQNLSWNALSGQLGSDYKEIKVFRHYVKKAVSKIRAFWPDLKAEFDNPEIITLYPSKPLITPKEMRQGKL